MSEVAEKPVVGYVGKKINLKQYKCMIAHATPSQRAALKWFYYTPANVYEPEKKEKA